MLKLESLLNLKDNEKIKESRYISRDLSWLKFNHRVFDQSRIERRTIFERLKFAAIAYTNFDEFFMIRIGSLYNYLDFGKDRTDYSGLKAIPFKRKLFSDIQFFLNEYYEYFNTSLVPLFEPNGFKLVTTDDLQSQELEGASNYFHETIYPMLTPVASDSSSALPLLLNKTLIFGVVVGSEGRKKINFVQVPSNLPRFYCIERFGIQQLLPIEEIVRWKMGDIFRNVNIMSSTLFRIIRNGDFEEVDVDDVDKNFIEEIRKKIKKRQSGRVVRLDVEGHYSDYLLTRLKKSMHIENDNVFICNNLLDMSCLFQIVGNPKFADKIPTPPAPVMPVSYQHHDKETVFETLKKQDILLHHPYNSMDIMLDVLDKAAEDKDVLAIKITIYRLAKKSRIVDALEKAALSGKHVSVLFEVKARFDEERNLENAQRLQKAGAFVIYGVGTLKTHCKLLMIVRKEGTKTMRYVHLSSGNYNEDTSKLYSDISLLTTNDKLANDVNELFNVITGNSRPYEYSLITTAPLLMKSKLLSLINEEIKNAKKGLPARIVIKVNSLQDKDFIDELYKASQAGVIITLIVRGICCLRPGREGLSDNISVISIVGDFLEHTRIYYFHNNGDPIVYSGSADVMVRSFERRIECLFMIVDPALRQEVINILALNIKDNMNSYFVLEDGNYVKETLNGDRPFNIHEQFFHVNSEQINTASAMISH
ncbi:MAG: polyphosphate kinase 1 [Opitutaceae bacterium]|nr:polyphosphate kinase 1 [Cytophagales bacterium]